MSTEVSAPSNPSNTGMKNQVDIPESCVCYEATGCNTVAIPPTSETGGLTSASKSKQRRCCFSLKPSEHKLKTTERVTDSQCRLASERIT